MVLRVFTFNTSSSKNPLVYILEMKVRTWVSRWIMKHKRPSVIEPSLKIEQTLASIPDFLQICKGLSNNII